MSTDKGQATDETATMPAVDENDKFAASRELAQANHDASVKANEALVVPEDESVKTELPAQPEATESDNPEQVDLSSDFPVAEVETAGEQPDVEETPTEETPVEEPVEEAPVEDPAQPDAPATEE